MTDSDEPRPDEPVAALQDAVVELFGAGRKVLEAVEQVLADPKLRQQMSEALSQLTRNAQGLFGALFDQRGSHDQRDTPPVEHIDLDGD